MSPTPVSDRPTPERGQGVEVDGLPRNKRASPLPEKLLGSYRSICASAVQDHGDRADKQFDVAPERPVVHVQVVERHHLREWDVTATEDLPKSGDPRQEVETVALPPDNVLVLVEDQRTGADEAHLSTQHIQKLGQLVQRPAP